MKTPTSRIDVPTIVMRVAEYDEESLGHLILELTRCVRILEARRKDKRLLPSFRRQAKAKLRTAKRSLARVQRELNERQQEHTA